MIKDQQADTGDYTLSDDFATQGVRDYTLPGEETEYEEEPSSYLVKLLGLITVLHLARPHHSAQHWRQSPHWRQGDG